MSNFETKEQYYQFIAAWKYAANHKNNKREWIERSQAYGGRYKLKSWLTPTHYVFRNLILGKPLDNGFSPKGENDWSTLESAIIHLKYLMGGSRRTEEFLKPFNGIVTKEQFEKLKGILEEAKKAA